MSYDNNKAATEADPLAELRRMVVAQERKPERRPSWWRRLLARLPRYSEYEHARRVQSARDFARDVAWADARAHLDADRSRLEVDRMRFTGAHGNLAEEVRAYRHRHRTLLACLKAHGIAEPPLAPLPGQRTTLEGAPPKCPECGREAT